MTDRDKYYNRSKQEGYRARSAYKLKQIDKTAGLLEAGDTVVDLGAAPGGWMQVAAEEVGAEGVVVGVDRQRIDPLDVEATVETVRGDMTEGETRERVVEVATEAGGGSSNGGGGSAEDRDGSGDSRRGPVDVVLSDLAPEMTGEYNVDQARSVHLARQAFETAEELLATGGHFVGKVFQGRDVDALVEDLEESFRTVHRTAPDASRDSSSEIYLVAKDHLTAPVAPGDELTVEVVEAGEEGDGIAYVEGFTVFVPGAEPGETVAVRIDDVKPRFAFAERTD